MNTSRETPNLAYEGMFGALLDFSAINQDGEMLEEENNDQPATEEDIRLALRNYIDASWRIFEKRQKQKPKLEEIAALPSEGEGDTLNAPV